MASVLFQSKKFHVSLLLCLLSQVVLLLGVAQANSALRGVVKVDGSSTVFPISEAVAEEFLKVHPRVRVTVGTSGTGGGFKKFTKGETDINDASRKIKDQEKKMAKQNKVTFSEFPIAYDGISVVVNKENTWVDHLTVAELKKLWAPGSQVKSWKDLRASWPDRKIKLYGPGTDSGTFDYFSEAINGKSGASRADFSKSEDDNALVQGVKGDKDSLGYFGFAYYEANKKYLKVVPIDAGKGAVVPNPTTIKNGTYKPLSRPVYIYVNQRVAQNQSTYEFVKFYLNSAAQLVRGVGYVPLTQKEYATSLNTLESLKK